MTPPDKAGQLLPSTPTDKPGQLEAVEQCYLRWFGKDYDLGALHCALAAGAAHHLDGDPPWLLVVGGSGAAKTETIVPLTGAGAITISNLNGEASLLSGTSKKDRAKNATGGLLRQFDSTGNKGMLVIKDFTSILSLNRDSRALVLAALREIYDGHWTRHVGTDGGATLTWKGRIVIVGAVTTAWDAAHEVISAMGDRFLLVRIDSRENREQAARQAMANVSHEATMRKELSESVAALLRHVTAGPQILTTAEMDDLFMLADLVTLCRTAVRRDSQGNPEEAHAPEMPTRFVKQLVQILRGGLAIGMDRKTAITAARRCAGDSMPPLRLRVLTDVAKNPQSPTTDVARRLQMPRKTVDRALQELQLLRVLTVGEAKALGGTRWIYSLADDSTKKALIAINLARNVSRGEEGATA